MDKTFKKCEDLKMKEEEFEKLVAEALDELPKAIQEKMDNIEVTVERGSVRGPYLGLTRAFLKMPGEGDSAWFYQIK